MWTVLLDRLQARRAPRRHTVSQSARDRRRFALGFRALYTPPRDACRDPAAALPDDAPLADARAVAALIERALSGEDALRAQGRHARERAERHFSLRARANGLAEIYREAVRGTSVSS